MGLVLKHVERTKSGSFQYRRRVPKDVSAIITKREFKRKLGDSEKEAVKAWTIYHAQVEREIAEAKRRAVMLDAGVVGSLTEREAYAEALRRHADLVAAGATETDLELVADSIADSFPQDEYEPVGVPPVDAHTINLLRLGPDRHKPPEATLGDARRLYLKEHIGEGQEGTDDRVVGLTNRVVDTAISAMGRDPTLSSITRDDARKVRDQMLARIKATGRGTGERVSAATVKRELAILSAVYSFGVREYDLGGRPTNPFSQLPVETLRRGEGDREAEKRDPLPAKVLTECRERVLSSCSVELGLIWRLLEATGCRIAEVTGLRVSDVVTGGDLPYLNIEAHPLRRLKTAVSRRKIPLVGDGLEAAKEALKLARTGNMVFPSYGRVRGGDAASAALMRQVRQVTKDEKHVIHSLRHNMKDRLILAEVSQLEQNLILGHSLGGVGDRVYGGEAAKLRAVTRALERALGV